MEPSSWCIWIHVLIVMETWSVTNGEMGTFLWQISQVFRYSELHSVQDMSASPPSSVYSANNVLMCLRICQRQSQNSFHFVEAEGACSCTDGTDNTDDSVAATDITGVPVDGTDVIMVSTGVTMEMPPVIMDSSDAAMIGDTGLAMYGTVIEAKMITYPNTQARMFIVADQKQDCLSLFKSHYTLDGIYTIYPDGVTPVDAYCDMTSGGWTVIQRRMDGRVDFDRGWDDYVSGFGIVTGEYWLGLENIHQLTTEPTELFIYLEASSDFQKPSAFARYSTFQVSSSSDNYRLTVTGYSGDAGDAMDPHNGMQFSTFDNDNDISIVNCASSHSGGGGWWYMDCHMANLNGLYLNGPHEPNSVGVEWYYFTGFHYSLKTAVVKIRRSLQ